MKKETGLNHYEINLVFDTVDDANRWLGENLAKHEDGIRELYNNEIVWAVNMRQPVDSRMRGGKVTLTTIDTWK